MAASNYDKYRDLLRQGQERLENNYNYSRHLVQSLHIAQCQNQVMSSAIQSILVYLQQMDRIPMMVWSPFTPYAPNAGIKAILSAMDQYSQPLQNQPSLSPFFHAFSIDAEATGRDAHVQAYNLLAETIALFINRLPYFDKSKCQWSINSIDDNHVERDLYNHLRPTIESALFRYRNVHLEIIESAIQPVTTTAQFVMETCRDLWTILATYDTQARYIIWIHNYTTKTANQFKFLYFAMDHPNMRWMADTNDYSSFIYPDRVLQQSYLQKIFIPRE